MTQGRYGQRQQNLEKKFGRHAIENCPVCGRRDHHSRIVRHLMSSRKNPAHGHFIEDQDNRILCLYDDMDAAFFDICAIAFADGIFCSPSHVRKIISQQRPDWKKKSNQKRSIDTSRQYEDGRRKRPTQFSDGSWKASKELGTGCYMNRDKRHAIINAFHSDARIKNVAAQIGCKSETVSKIWKEEFGKEAYETRLDRTWRFRKPSIEFERQIISLFSSDKSAHEIASIFKIHSYHVAEIWKKTYSKKAYKQRMLRMRKLGILKSLKVMGGMAVSGSRPEQACFEILSKICCTEVIHHDMETLPSYEIDITLPQWKTAVCWDGPMHRRPIFGQKKLIRVMRRDADKRKTLLQMGWTVVVVEDECKKFKCFDMEAVASAIMDEAAFGGLKKIIIDSGGRMRYPVAHQTEQE
jgi:hypothetical protein